MYDYLNEIKINRSKAVFKKGKAEYIFNQYYDMKSVPTSLLIPSDTEIARLVDDEYYASLMVIGDIYIIFHGKSYREPEEYPPELVYLLEHLNPMHYEDADDVFQIIDNNWCEIAVYDNGGNLVNEDNYETSDAEGADTEEIFDMLFDEFKRVKNKTI